MKKLMAVFLQFERDIKKLDVKTKRFDVGRKKYPFLPFFHIVLIGGNIGEKQFKQTPF